MIRKLFFVVTFVLFLLVSSCHVARYFYWNYADIKDWKKFPSLPVSKGANTFYFTESAHPISPILPPDVAGEQDFDGFLKQHKTVSFLIVRNDTILYERYFGEFADSSILASFSVSKAFVSALTGIAISEGKIGSADDPVTRYIPELLENDVRFSKIRIEDLLNMRSGIKFSEAYSNPFAEMSKYYYGTNLSRTLSTLKIKTNPNQTYDYISVNTQLLGMAIERSTGKKLSDYLTEKIWNRIGMEFDANWNMDSKKNGQIKHFCCLNGRTRDFARFGRLVLNDGNWQGEQIIPEAWMKRTKSVFNDSKDSQNYNYTYAWRVKDDGAIFAKGILGQYIYIDQVKGIIIVRFGKHADGINWAYFFEKICGQL